MPSQVLQDDLDSLIRDFQNWQQSYSSISYDNLNLELEVKNLEKQSIDDGASRKQLKQENAQLREQIDRLHATLKSRCDLQTENRKLKLELENMTIEASKQKQQSMCEHNRMVQQLEDVKQRHKQEMQDLEDCHSAQMAVESSNSEKVLKEKCEKIQQLEQKILEIEREKHSEIVKLRLEYDSKMLILQKQMNKYQQSVAASSSNHDVYRRKLQHYKSEHEREVTTLKRKVSHLESQVTDLEERRARTVPFPMKKRKY